MCIVSAEPYLTSAFSGASSTIHTWLSAVAEMGGYVGLLLGIAVVDIAFAADRFWPMISDLWKSENIVKVAFEDTSILCIVYELSHRPQI